MNARKFGFGLAGAGTAALMFALIFSVPSVFAREAESGGGSNSNSGGSDSGIVTSANPRPDDNPSASDLIEGTRVLAPEVSGGNGNSGSDSARDIFERNLAFGMMNDDGVAHLQRELADDGFFHVSATGNFLALTKQAVMEFQKEHGIPATGFVGQLTRNELNNRIRNRGTNSSSNSNRGTGSIQISTVDNIAKQIKDLQEKVKQLQVELEKEKLAQAQR